LTAISRAQTGDGAARERFDWHRGPRKTIWERNFNHTISWNDSLQKLFHYPVEEIEPTVAWWQDHIHPAERVKVIYSIQAAIDQKWDFWSKEYRFRLVDDSYADIFDRGYILYNEQNEPVRMIGAMMDITERKQMDDRLVEESTLLHTLIDNLQDSIFVKDVDSRIVVNNTAHQRRLGEHPGAGCGKDRFRFLPQGTGCLILCR
jgi:PAS domain-containing protein